MKSYPAIFSIPVIILLFLFNTFAAAESPKPRNGSKIIVVNDDGFSKFHSGHYQSAADLRDEMLGYQNTQTAVVEWCILAGSRANYPSKVTELIGTGMVEFPRRGDKLAYETVHRLAKEGINTLQVVADACHEAGISCYASMRMNGDYPASMWDGSFPRFANSTFWWEHPEYRQRDAKGNTLTKFSYAFPEVRSFKLAILREAAQQNIDGINLDFLRHPTFFGYEEPLIKAFQDKYGIDAATVSTDDPRWIPLRSEIMTRFVRDVRKILDEAEQRTGRKLGLSARIDWKKYPLWGCDIKRWMEEKLLDYLVVSQHGLGGYEFPIAPFVEMARGSGCAILFGEEAVLSGHDRTSEEDRRIAEGTMEAPERNILSLEQYKSRAARWYSEGADGLQLFNETRKEILGELGDIK
ncbi:MAG: family 10 glycosylhydrolase [Candidatus Hydrogenedentes bacterium]|nr:family 10 glycosylhydrolase [Candidatus Hydrogenedentota bacterium]